MLFYVKHGGKEYKIRVESRRNRLYVAFEDEPEERIDLVFQGNDCSFVRNHRVFYANVVGKKSDYTVWSPSGNVEFQVESEYKRIVSQLRGQNLQSENQVRAKMPGKIVKILVREDQPIGPGDPVLVMEAMKMENEIRATAAGVISKIHVTEGQAVESNALLIETRPPDE